MICRSYGAFARPILSRLTGIGFARPGSIQDFLAGADSLKRVEDPADPGAEPTRWTMRLSLFRRRYPPKKTVIVTKHYQNPTLNQSREDIS